MQSAIYARRAVVAERERELVLYRGMADATVIRCGWRARGDVTSYAVTTSAGGGLYEARGLACAVIRVPG